MLANSFGDRRTWIHLPFLLFWVFTSCGIFSTKTIDDPLACCSIGLSYNEDLVFGLSTSELIVLIFGGSVSLILSFKTMVVL